jgi:hypothetical protein
VAAGSLGTRPMTSAKKAVNVAGLGTLDAEVAEFELVSCGASLSR